MGNPWEIRGKSMGNPWEMDETTWKPHGKARGKKTMISYSQFSFFFTSARSPWMMLGHKMRDLGCQDDEWVNTPVIQMVIMILICEIYIKYHTIHKPA